MSDTFERNGRICQLETPLGIELDFEIEIFHIKIYKFFTFNVGEKNYHW